MLISLSLEHQAEQRDGGEFTLPLTISVQTNVEWFIQGAALFFLLLSLKSRGDRVRGMRKSLRIPLVMLPGTLWYSLVCRPGVPVTQSFAGI